MVILVALGMGTASSRVQAEVTCKPLFGHFESQVVTNFDPSDPDACTSPIGFCTDGRVIGGLQGSFRLTVGSFIPVNALSGVDSPVAFFVGESVITIKNTGDRLVGTDTGALNQANGQIATLLTFTEGTGQLFGASGQIVISGTADAVTGTNIGDFRGEVCTP
jgi:hypothetical protein